MTGYTEFKSAIDGINQIMDFIQTKLDKVERFKLFINNIVTELGKLGDSYKDNKIFEIHTSFNESYTESVVNHYSKLEKYYQNVKDEYHSLMKNKHQDMLKAHKTLKQQAEDTVRKVKEIDEALNADLISQLNGIVDYAENHCCEHLKIEFETDCQSCHYSLNEIISANQSVQLKRDQINTLFTQVQYPKGGGDPRPKEVELSSHKGKYTAGQYRNKLNESLEQIKQLKDDDIVVVK